MRPCLEYAARELDCGGAPDGAHNDLALDASAVHEAGSQHVGRMKLFGDDPLAVFDVLAEPWMSVSGRCVSDVVMAVYTCPGYVCESAGRSIASASAFAAYASVAELAVACSPDEPVSRSARTSHPLLKYAPTICICCICRCCC